MQTVREGPDWVPLEYRRDIVPGSALDFSGLGIQDAPAGKHGWLVSRNGHAEFEWRPGVPARFYGVNLCMTANFLADDEIELVTDRLVRLGYNAIRIHHHDDEWAKSVEARDRLDALIAACVRKGLYITTDLYVSRKCTWRELGVDRDGVADISSAKMLMVATEAGFGNWKRFAADFLTHVNHYTGRSLAQEPAMPLLVLINESSPHSNWNAVKGIPEYRALWREWLAGERAMNPRAFPVASPDEFPETGGWWDPSPESSAKAAFWTWCCERFSRRATAFLREELGVRAMLTAENNGPVLPGILRMRGAVGDYADFHFYPVDANVASDAAREETGLPLSVVFENFSSLAPFAGRYNTAFNRIWGLPLVASESATAGPNFTRAFAGLATGAFAAVQDWTGLWTFAYAHQREKLFDGADFGPGRYDLSLDPLMQAADRLAPLLFLRGDQRTPEAAFANYFSDEAMRADTEGAALSSTAPWAQGVGRSGNGLEWRARLGVAFEGSPLPDGVVAIPAAGGERQADGNKPDAPPCGVAVDGEKGKITVSGERTSGGFVHDGGSFDAGALSATVLGHGALVAASSLDGEALRASSRILVWHLTDLHGDGFSWGGKVVKSSYWPQEGMLSWGSARCMLHAGEADIALRVDAPSRVFALGTDGRREREVPCEWIPAGGCGVLRFTASARQPFGGCMYYEVVRDDPAR